MGPRDATALRVSPGRRADGWPVSEAGPQSRGTSGEGAGTVMGSTSRPGTRPLLSETAGGRRRGIGPGSELAILKGTRVTCADWRSSSPACSGHQQAPSGRDRASPLLGSLPAVTGMETLGGVCRRISAPARVLPGDAPARPLPRVSPRLQKGQEARGAFHTTAGRSPVPSASVKQRPLTYDSDREKKDGPNLGMSQTWPRGTRPAALAGETSVSVRSRLPFRFEGFSNLIVRVSAVMAIDALSRQKPSALDGFTGCLGAPVGCAGHDGWLHGVTEPCSWPAFRSGGDCVLARPLPSAPAWLRCIKTQITADRSGRLQRDPDRSQVTSP